MAMLEIKELSFTYPGRKEKALDNINITLEEGSFTVLCGQTGSGKTTLLKLIKREIAPFGRREGAILLEGRDIAELSDRQSVSEIAFVNQNPDIQLVCDRVWHELAFTLEGLGADSSLIRRRCGEVSSFLGIAHLFERTTDSLSGGEQQLVCLGAALVSNPRLLILDEPLSRLDPVSAMTLINGLRRINSELGIGVIICEHKLENLPEISDKIIILHKGRVVYNDSPKGLGEMDFCPVEKNLPPAMQLFRGLGMKGKCPLNTAEGRQIFENVQVKDKTEDKPVKGKALMEAKGLYFGYGKDKLILKNTALRLYEGMHYALMGGNGMGKSTLLYVLSGAYKPLGGKIRSEGKIIMLPQNPINVFDRDTVGEEVGNDELLEELGLDAVKNSHPLDISGGQQQLTAFGKAIALKPHILLLDEPEKALDGDSRHIMGSLIKRLTAEGATVLTVSHDVEFCGEWADYCGLFFDGSIISSGGRYEFFTNNICYTTSVCKMLGGRAITVGEVLGK